MGDDIPVWKMVPAVSSYFMRFNYQQSPFLDRNITGDPGELFVFYPSNLYR
jgi:hypothetical protein